VLDDVEVEADEEEADEVDDVLGEPVEVAM
jgi:hypothetical protein